jgi:hypothetical protein
MAASARVRMGAGASVSTGKMCGCPCVRAKVTRSWTAGAECAGECEWRTQTANDWVSEWSTNGTYELIPQLLPSLADHPKVHGTYTSTAVRHIT